jgi:hypothetical protein
MATVVRKAVPMVVLLRATGLPGLCLYTRQCPSILGTYLRAEVATFQKLMFTRKRTITVIAPCLPATNHKLESRIALETRCLIENWIREWFSSLSVARCNYWAKASFSISVIKGDEWVNTVHGRAAGDFCDEGNRKFVCKLTFKTIN